MTLTTTEVWDAIENDGLFGVLAFVNRRSEARSVGVVFVTHDRSLLISDNQLGADDSADPPTALGGPLCRSTTTRNRSIRRRSMLSAMGPMIRS